MATIKVYGRKDGKTVKVVVGKPIDAAAEAKRLLAEQAENVRVFSPKGGFRCHLDEAGELHAEQFLSKVN